MTFSDTFRNPTEMQGIGLLRLRTLVRLRWLAVIGQSIAIFAVHYILGFKVPLGPCLAIIAMSAWLNIFLTLRWRGGQRLASRPAGLLLGYDVLQLASLLYLTGGMENPFAFLFLASYSFRNLIADTLDIGVGPDCVWLL
jgi:two-component system, sensor histidine kinase RegB